MERCYRSVLQDGRQGQLEEIAREGIQSSAKALSLMLGREIEIEAPAVRLLPISSVCQTVGHPEEVVAAVYLLIEGDSSGYILLFFPQANALQLVDMLMDLPVGSTTGLGDLERSALGEAANVAGSAFLNRLAVLTALSCRPSPPAVVIDMAWAILDVVLVEAARYGDDVLMLEMIFVTPEQQVKGFFWVIPTPELLQAALAAKIMGKEG